MKRIVGNNFFDLEMKYVWFSLVIGSVVGFFSSYGNHVLLFSLLIVLLAFFLLRYAVNLEKVFFSLFLLVIIIPKIPIISTSSRVAIRFEDIFIVYLWVLAFIYILKKDIKVPKNTVFFWIGLYFLGALISTSLGIFKGNVTNLFFFLRKIEYVSLFFFAYIVINKENIKKFYKLIFISFGIVLFVGMIQYSGILNQLGITQLFVKYLQPMSSRFWVPLDAPTRSVSSTFDGNYDLGGYFILTVPFFLLLYFAKNREYKKAILLGFISSLILLAFSGSRGPIIAIFLIILFVVIKHLFFSTQRKMIKALFISIIFLTLFVGGYKIFFKLFFKRSSNLIMIFQGDTANLNLKKLDESAYRRQKHWIMSYNAFITYPLFGMGMGAFSEYFVTPDGQYIQALGETGLTGLILFLCMLFYIIKMNLRTKYYLKNLPQDRLNELSKNFIMALSLGILGLMADSVTISIFDSSKVAMCFWSFVGVAAKLNSIIKSEHSKLLSVSGGVHDGE